MSSAIDLILSTTRLPGLHCYHWQCGSRFSYITQLVLKAAAMTVTVLFKVTTLKVTNFCTDWNSICDFLFLTNTNLYLISHWFWVIAACWSSYHFWPWPTVPLLTALCGMTPELCTVKFSLKRTRKEALLYRVIHNIFQCIELFKCGSPLWQTDGQNNSRSIMCLMMR